MSYRLFLLASLFLCQLAFSSSIPHLCNKDESISLVTFKKSLTIDPSASADCDYSGQPYYGKISSWNMSRDCCSWDGVICDEMTGHVVELDLSCSQLVGNINSNSSLFQLYHLQRLNLSRNTLSNSHISPLFGKLSSLTHLDLSCTSFSGQIPSEISHLSKLLSLHLLNYDIQLGPHNFKILLQNLTQLRLFDLRLVNISSTIPPKFSSHLTTLRLGDTDLYGIIPERIFHLSNLKELDLSYNDHLSGYFPTTKWNSMASIEELYLSQVDFSGSFLPESIGYLTSLRYVMLNSCNLSGKIPKSLWNLTRLEHLDLKDNLLEGSIPLFTSGLQNLSYLRLLNNLLNGVIPSWKFSLPSLSKLDLKDNHFCGQHEDFRYNSVLTHIDLGHNQLQGYLSESIQKLVNLASIHLEHNQFQGPLPKSLQNLVNLTWLNLSSNNFSGNVDVSIFSNLKQLFLLELSHNSISLTNENNVNSTLPESVESSGLSGCEKRELDFLRSAKQLSY
ncbi:receptor-like protein Cf-9 [Capsicum galapagoense]